MDLFGPMRKLRLGGKKYGLVIGNICSKAICVFSTHNNDSFKVFEVFYKRLQIKNSFYISSIRSDHDIELKGFVSLMTCTTNSLYWE